MSTFAKGFVLPHRKQLPPEWVCRAAVKMSQQPVAISLVSHRCKNQECFLEKNGNLEWNGSFSENMLRNFSNKESFGEKTGLIQLYTGSTHLLPAKLLLPSQKSFIFKIKKIIKNEEATLPRSRQASGERLLSSETPEGHFVYGVECRRRWFMASWSHSQAHMKGGERAQEATSLRKVALEQKNKFTVWYRWHKKVRGLSLRQTPTFAAGLEQRECSRCLTGRRSASCLH